MICHTNGWSIWEAARPSEGSVLSWYVSDGNMWRPSNPQELAAHKKMGKLYSVFIHTNFSYIQDPLFDLTYPSIRLLDYHHGLVANNQKKPPPLTLCGCWLVIEICVSNYTRKLSPKKSSFICKLEYPGWYWSEF